MINKIPDKLKNKVAFYFYSIFKKISYKDRNKILKFIRKWNDKNGVKVTYGVDLPCDGAWGKVFEKSDIFPLTKLEFCKKRFNVPRNYDNILKILYGDYLELPKEEERRWHAKNIEIYE